MKINLEAWINKKYLSDEAIFRLKQKYTSAKPYQYLELDDFFNAKMLKGLITALEYEEFELKNSDLFKFSQTQDIKSSNIKELKGFRTFLISKEFVKIVEKITGETLKLDAYMHATKYQDTDYLLCHDDLLEKRKLAFMVYLNDLEDSDGGALRLYDHVNKKPKNIIKKITPKFNKLVLFKVSNISYHDVEEVTKDIDRMTIGWWYYG